MKRRPTRRTHWNRPRLTLRHKVSSDPDQRPLLLLIAGLAAAAIVVAVMVGYFAKRELGRSVSSIKTAITADFERTVKDSVGDIVDEFNRRSTDNIKEAVYPNRFRVGIELSGHRRRELPEKDHGEYYLPSRVEVHPIATKKKDVHLRVKIKNDSEYPANFVGVSLYLDEESFMESTVDIWDKLRRLGLVTTYMEAPPLIVDDGRGEKAKLKGCRFTYDQFESKVPESFCCFDLMLKKDKGFLGVKVRDNVFIFAMALKAKEPK